MDSTRLAFTPLGVGDINIAVDSEIRFSIFDRAPSRPHVALFDIKLGGPAKRQDDLNHAISHCMSILELEEQNAEKKEVK